MSTEIKAAVDREFAKTCDHLQNVFEDTALNVIYHLHPELQNREDDWEDQKEWNIVFQKIKTTIVAELLK